MQPTIIVSFTSKYLLVGSWLTSIVTYFHVTVNTAIVFEATQIRFKIFVRNINNLMFLIPSFFNEKIFLLAYQNKYSYKIVFNALKVHKSSNPQHRVYKLIFSYTFFYILRRVGAFILFSVILSGPHTHQFFYRLVSLNL